MTVIVAIAIAAISLLTFTIIGITTNSIKNLFGVEDNLSSLDEDEPKEVLKKYKQDELYINGQKVGLREYLSKQTYHVDKTDNNIDALNKELGNALSQIGTGSVSCINDCKRIDSVLSKSYFKTNNGYLVTIKDGDGNSYSISFNKKTDKSGNTSFEINNVYNNTKSLKDENDKYNNLSKKENNREGFSYNKKYDETYISQSNIIPTTSFSSNDELAGEVYDSSKDSILLLNSYSNGAIVDHSNGFYITPCIVVTSWEYVLSAIKNNSLVTGVSANGTNNKVVGVVSMEEDSDIAILKMEKSVGVPVTLGTPVLADEVLLLSSNTGFGVSGFLGVNIGNGDVQTMDLYSSNYNNGSAIFNSKGEVIGALFGNEKSTPLSLTISSVILKKYQRRYINANYDSIKTYSLADLTEEFYSINEEEERSIDVIDSNKLYKKYKNLFDIELELVKFGSNDKETSISLRYKNNSEVDNDIVLSSFLKKLKENGYEEVLNTGKKKEYKGKLDITVYYEFNYVIIVAKER